MLTAVYILGAIIAIFLVVVALQPSDFRISRSITIAAQSAAIFPHVNNPQKFNAWNPWGKIDPNAKTTFEGTAEGAGSTMRWEGNHEVGKGSMTNVESRANELIQFKMEFLKPMQATNTAEFTFKPEANGTVVTWSMYGKNSFLGKAINLIMNCDKMVGGQFEKGLKDLKQIVEAK